MSGNGDAYGGADALQTHRFDGGGPEPGFAGRSGRKGAAVGRREL
jgi:hypothetical protein